MVRKKLSEKFENDVKKRHYLFRILLAIDQLLNVIFWNGSQDETISSHIGRKIKNNKANFLEKFICLILSKFDYKHCEKSIGE